LTQYITEYTKYSVFRILKKYESQNVPPLPVLCMFWDQKCTFWGQFCTFLALPVLRLILFYFCKNFAKWFDVIYSVYTEYSGYSVFRISQKYESHNISPFEGPYCTVETKNIFVGAGRGWTYLSNLDLRILKPLLFLA